MVSGAPSGAPRRARAGTVRPRPSSPTLTRPALFTQMAVGVSPPWGMKPAARSRPLATWVMRLQAPLNETLRPSLFLLSMNSRSVCPSSSSVAMKNESASRPALRTSMRFLWTRALAFSTSVTSCAADGPSARIEMMRTAAGPRRLASVAR